MPRSLAGAMSCPLSRGTASAQMTRESYVFQAAVLDSMIFCRPRLMLSLKVGFGTSECSWPGTRICDLEAFSAGQGSPRQTSASFKRLMPL